MHVRSKILSSDVCCLRKNGCIVIIVQIWSEPRLAFILPLIAMLTIVTKEPEMLQPDVFCEHTMQQNATAAGAPHIALPQAP